MFGRLKRVFVFLKGKMWTHCISCWHRRYFLSDVLEVHKDFRVPVEVRFLENRNFYFTHRGTLIPVHIHSKQRLRFSRFVISFGENSYNLLPGRLPSTVSLWTQVSWVKNSEGNTNLTSRGKAAERNLCFMLFSLIIRKHRSCEENRILRRWRHSFDGPVPSILRFWGESTTLASRKQHHCKRKDPLDGDCSDSGGTSTETEAFDPLTCISGGRNISEADCISSQCPVAPWWTPLCTWNSCHALDLKRSGKKIEVSKPIFIISLFLRDANHIPATLTRHAFHASECVVEVSLSFLAIANFYNVERSANEVTYLKVFRLTNS